MTATRRRDACKALLLVLVWLGVTTAPFWTWTGVIRAFVFVALVSVSATLVTIGWRWSALMAPTRVRPKRMRRAA